MIRVTRLPAPQTLKKKAKKWIAQLISARTNSQRERVLRRYRNAEVRQTLVAMFHGKCAYCESRITHVDYGHIEHYRPKAGPSGRPDLAFEWSNLLLACGICNGASYKSDRFPEAADGGPIINPCEDDPACHFEFHYDPIAKLASVYGVTSRGEVTERLLGMNRWELRQQRSNLIRKLVVIAQFAASDSEAAEILRSAQQSEAEYAAFARSLFG